MVCYVSSMNNRNKDDRELDSILRPLSSAGLLPRPDYRSEASDYCCDRSADLKPKTEPDFLNDGLGRL